VSPETVRVRPAGDEHQVVTVTGARGAYRRRPCGGPESTPGRPGCPWRVDAVGHFPAEAFAHSADTAHDMAGHRFACHESGTAHPATCAGFLLRGADHNMAVRMSIATGLIDMGQVDDGGHLLHPGYVSMAQANGVRAEALRGCRLSYEEEQR
jgi:Family of unknown function (DUF6283)